jgi:hypothetical protein
MHTYIYINIYTYVHIYMFLYILPQVCLCEVAKDQRCPLLAPGGHQEPIGAPSQNFQKKGETKVTKTSKEKKNIKNKSNKNTKV